jgi:hypothetical protein
MEVAVAWHIGPWHAPLAHEYWHVTLAPQVPLALQVCCVTLSEHCVAPTEQTPPHADPRPVPTHVLPVQTVGLPHAPVDVQLFCVVVSRHSVWPGAQTPWQCVPTPVPEHVWLVHVVALPHVPVAVQLFCTVVLEHSV